MSYINDPREMAIRPESGFTLEQDNRYEEMYHWGAMVVDLCGMPVEEYMKPMTVIGVGGGGSSSGNTPIEKVTEEVKIYLSIYKNDELVSGENYILPTAEEGEANNIWKAQWEWIGDFPGQIRVAATITTDSGEYLVSKDLVDNEDKKDYAIIEEAKGEYLTSFKNFGVGSIDTPKEDIINHVYNEIISDETVEYHYKYEVSTEENIVYLTLKLVLDGNVKLKRSNLKFNDEIPFSEVNTEKEGYNFIGWVDSKGNMFNGVKMPPYDLTLTGKYEVKKCEIDFYFILDDVKEYVTGYTVNYGSRIPSLPSTKKTGYTFKGWEPSVSTSTIVKDNMEIYGYFESIIYIVTWSGYTDGVLTQDYKYGETLIEPTKPEKEGYTFVGWDKTIPEIVTSNLSFKAKFTINKYNITYHEVIDGIESKPLSSITLTYNYTIPSKNKPVKSGYTYSDWQGYNSENGKVFNGTKMPAFNLKYITVRTTNEYLLGYYDNNELVNEEKHLYNTEIIPFVYEKEGWTVSEWEGLPSLMPYYNVSAHCTSFINSYEVKFVDQYGNEYIVEAQYGTPIKDIVPVIDGKTFEIPAEFENETVGSESIIIQGNVVVNSYKVVITINGIEEEVELLFGTNIEDYINENYEAEEGYHIVIDSTHETVPSDDSLVVNVTYEPNIWILSYHTTGAFDDMNGSKEVAFGTPILNELPEISNLVGYYFDGWYNGETKISETDLMPNHNLYVNGEYIVKTYNVIVKDGDIIILDETYEYGTSMAEIINNEAVISYLNNLENSGYIGVLKINGNDIDESSIIESDIEIIVERSEKEYVLTFMNGDIIISSEIVKFNSIIVYPVMDNYNEDGTEYIFQWEDESYNGKNMPSMDLTIKGQYQAKSEAPIYYGSFKVSKSAYTPDSTTQYLDVEKLETEHYGVAVVSECFGEGLYIQVPIIGDPEMQGMNAIQKRNYLKLWTQPLSVLIPCDVADENTVQLFNAAGIDTWHLFSTDKQVVSYRGNNYYFYVQYDDETLNPVATSETLNFTLKLIKK